ncbi:hypothetical protein [Xenorhabdus stockiae]
MPIAVTLSLFQINLTKFWTVPAYNPTIRVTITPRFADNPAKRGALEPLC